MATPSLASSKTSPHKNLNAIARLFRDGSIRKYQFISVYIYISHYFTSSPRPLHHTLVSSTPSSLSPILTPLFQGRLRPQRAGGQVHTGGHFRTGGHSAQRSAAAQCSGTAQLVQQRSRSLAARPVIFYGVIIYFIHSIVLPIIGHH